MFLPFFCVTLCSCTDLHDDEDVVDADAEEEEGDDEGHLAGRVAQQGARAVAGAQALKGCRGAIQ